MAGIETPDEEIVRLQRLRASLLEEAADAPVSAEGREEIAGRVAAIDREIEYAVNRSLAWKKGPADWEVLEGMGCAVMAAVAGGINYVATSGDGYYRLFFIGVAFGAILIAIGTIKSIRYSFEERRVRRRRAAGLPHPEGPRGEGRGPG